MPYLINLSEQCHFGLGIGYVYNVILFSCVTILEQKGKSNVTLLYFQNIRALKKN